MATTTARTVGEPFGIGWLLVFPPTVAGIVALDRRRRSADGEAREQLRLLFRAALVVVVGFVACLIGSVAAPTAFDIGAAAGDRVAGRPRDDDGAWRSCATGSTGSTCT